MEPRPQRTRRVDLPPRHRGRRPSDIACVVLRAVLDHGPVARSSVARLTGFSPSSLTPVTARLIDDGLLREAPEAAGKPGVGRPHVPLEIDTDSTIVVGAHIAVPHVTIALVDLRGRVLVQERHSHEDTGPAAVLDRLTRVTTALISRHAAGRRVLGFGVATGGWVDSASGVVVEHELLGWRDVPVRSYVADAMGLPVHVDGHSRALLRAEQLFGSHTERARSSLLHLFVGNMVDVAFATGDAIQQGPRSAAGAVAHLPLGVSEDECRCGRRGCFQASVSEQVYVRRAFAEGIIERPLVHDLIASAERGDLRAVALFHERARIMGRGVASLLELYNPEVLVVEAGVSRFAECLAVLLREVESTSRMPAVGRVVPTSFGGNVLVIAGATVALNRIFSAPFDRDDRFSNAS